VMVPTRVDIADTEPVNRFERSFRNQLFSFSPPVFATLKTNFWKLLIPYVRDYAYAEKRAIGATDSNPFLVEAYKQLAAHLAMLAPAHSTIRRQFAHEIKRVFSGIAPSVLVTDLGRRTTVAPALRERLEQREIKSWPEPAAAAGQEPEWQDVASLIDQCRCLALVLTAASIRSELVLRVWRYARQQGIWVYPISGGPELSPNHFATTRRSSRRLRPDSAAPPRLRAFPSWHPPSRPNTWSVPRN